MSKDEVVINPPQYLNYKRDVEELESNFQIHWKQKDWTAIWYDLEACARNIIKKETQHHFRHDFNEIVDEVVINQFQRLKNHVKKDPNYTVRNLCTYIYLPAKFTLKCKKRQFLEQQCSLEQLMENHLQFEGEFEDEM